MADKTLDERVQDLPPELFNIIYQHIFTAAEGSRAKPTFAADGGTVKTDRVIGERPSINLQMVDKASRDQYKKQYYGKTDSVFENGEVMVKWVRDLTPATWDMVRSVKLFSRNTQHDSPRDVQAAMIIVRDGLLREGTLSWTYTSGTERFCFEL